MGVESGHEARMSQFKRISKVYLR